jgi:CRP-like cAMP-binding protein
MHFISYVAPLLKPVKYSDKEMIYETGEYANEMYFIVKGEVSFVISSNGSRYSFVKVKDNYYFGETDIILSPLKTHMTSVQATSNCDLLSLSRENFESILEIFEDEAFEIIVMAQERHERIFKKMESAMVRMKKKLEPEAKYSAYYKREDFEKELVSYRKSICRGNRRSDSSLVGKLRRQKTPKTHIFSLKNKIKMLIIHTDHFAALSKETLELARFLRQE